MQTLIKCLKNIQIRNIGFICTSQMNSMQHRLCCIDYAISVNRGLFLNQNWFRNYLTRSIFIFDLQAQELCLKSCQIYQIFGIVFISAQFKTKLQTPNVTKTICVSGQFDRILIITFGFEDIEIFWRYILTSTSLTCNNTRKVWKFEFFYKFSRKETPW